MEPRPRRARARQYPGGGQCRHLEAAYAGEQRRGSDAARVASLWFRRKVADGIAEKTRQDLDWQLAVHILPFLGADRLSAIDAARVEAFKEHKLDERSAIFAARAAGEPLRDVRGRPRRTLSNGSINKLLVLLATILKNAVRRGLMETNAATDVVRLPTRRRQGDILEADELESLIEAAGELTGRADAPDIARLRWLARLRGRRACLRHRPRALQDPRQGRQDRCRGPRGRHHSPACRRAAGLPCNASG